MIDLKRNSWDKAERAPQKGSMGTFKSMPVRKEVSEISARNSKLLTLTRQEEMGWAAEEG